MAMAVDNRQNSQMTTMPYDPMRGYPPAPHFTNPWVSAPQAPSTLYPTTSGIESGATRPAGASMPPFQPLSSTAPALGSGIPLSLGLMTQNLLDVQQGILDSSRSYAGSYTSASSPTTSAYAPTSAPQYAADPYRGSPYGYQSAEQARRESHPSVHPDMILDPSLEATREDQSAIIDQYNRLASQSQRGSFSEALDSARGMVQMSQTDLTPRNIYGNGNPRTSTDSYGFPSAHSSHSSISSASTYPSYYNGSVDGSVTDYSSASEAGDMGSRTLPRPSALVGTSLPPAPQSMMGQFSSKVSSSSQKKHKCKICDKRFTRPSSLQTHMYSHTGEKRKHPDESSQVTLLTFKQLLPAKSKDAVVTSLSFPTCGDTEKCTRMTVATTHPLRKCKGSAPIAE